jgi:hypothetical protein
MPLSRCPKELPNELSDLIVKFAQGWAKYEQRPKPNKAICDKWEELLEAWINDANLPLFIRKSSLGRGKLISSNGRIIIPTDNSPAQWAYSLACQKKCPSISKVREWHNISSTESNPIPVAMILSRAEQQSLGYGVKLPREFNVNHYGWKLGHIKKIGLQRQGDIDGMNLDHIKEHHWALLNPNNMFLIPMQWAGLAEVDEVASSIHMHNIKVAKM